MKWGLEGLGDVSLLMLKPDGIALCLHGTIERMIEEAGLRVACTHGPVLEGALLDVLAGEHCTDDHVMEHALYRLQHGGRRVQFWVLEGERAIAHALDIREYVRNTFGRGTFANVLHAPDDMGEWTRQVRVLGTTCRRCAAHVRRVEATRELNPPCMVATPFAHEPARAEQIRSIVVEMWNDPMSPVWKPWGVPPAIWGDPERARWELVVHDNDDWSLDTIIDALTTVLGLDLRWAVRLAAQGATSNVVRAVRCGREAAVRCRDALLERYPLAVTVEPVVASDGRLAGSDLN